MIQAEKFANYVEENRQALIQHCKENGVEASDKDSLGTIVAKDKTIPYNSGKKEVTFADVDGTVILKKFVDIGGSVTPPTETPNYDPEYLEFVEWASDGDLNNVQYDITCLPRYRIKINVDGFKPTILKCDIQPDKLAFTLNAVSPNATIDWGDGTIEKLLTSATTHTYASGGLYIVKIYGTYVTLGGQQKGLDVDGNVIHDIYVGDNVVLADYSLHGARKMKVFLFSEDIAFNSKPSFDVGFEWTFNYCENLRTFVFPKKSSVYRMFQSFSYAYNLKYIILPQSEKVRLDQFNSVFHKCVSLQSIVIPKHYTTYPSAASVFTECWNLKQVIFEDISATMNPASGGWFRMDYKLSTINSLPRLTNIPTSFFEGCQSLKRVEIPDSVKSIAGNTFKDCNNIEYLEIKNPLCQINSNAFPTTFVNEIVFPSNYNGICSSSIPLMDYNSLINIAKRLKDNSGLTTNTIKFTNACKALIQDLKIDNVPLLEYIQNKNWTVSFAN